MPLLARQHATYVGSSLLAALVGGRRAAGSASDRLARQQLWREIPTFVGVLAAVLGALFL